MVALLIRGRVREQENILLRLAKRMYAPALSGAGRLRVLFLIHATAIFVARIPSTALEQSTRMQASIERALMNLPEVAFVFSKTGTGDVASDPMPPSVSDTFVILKPRAQWPKPKEPKEALRQRMQEIL